MILPFFTAPKRRVWKVFIHCSASDNPKHDDISVIRDWHINERHFADVGYHYFIRSTGEIQNGRDVEVVPAAQQGYNTGSIAICLHGKDHFTIEQFTSLITLCGAIHGALPKVTFHGHCEVSQKLCPNFNYRNVLGLDEKGNLKP